MKVIKLGEAATFVNGKAFKPSDWATEGKKIVRIQNLTDVGSTYNYYNGPIESKYIINKGDILISWSASIGVYEWSGEEAVLNQHIFKVVFDKYEFDKSYFKYLMESKIREILSKVHGSTMKHITKKDFDKIDIEYIDIETQRNIARQLDGINNLIMIKKQDLKDYNLLINSKLNELTIKEQNFIELGKVANFINGDRSKNYPSSEEIKNKGDIPFINAGLINGIGFNWENMNYISKSTYDRLSSGKIQKNDILYCLRGSLGKHGYVNDDMTGAIASSLVIIRSDVDKIMPKYLYYLLDTDDVIVQLEKVKNGSTQPNLSSGNVKKFKIKYPNVEIQKQFVNYVETIDKLIKICESDIIDLVTILNVKEDLIFNK